MAKFLGPTFRENGLIEWTCEHGCGHPSRSLTKPKYYYATHGCCGCCNSVEFRDLERISAPALELSNRTVV